jgi:hypothetical protein
MGGLWLGIPFKGTIVNWYLEMEELFNIFDFKQTFLPLEIQFSHFWDRPVPIFSDVRFSYLALVQDKLEAQVSLYRSPDMSADIVLT